MNFVENAKIFPEIESLSTESHFLGVSLDQIKAYLVDDLHLHLHQVAFCCAIRKKFTIQ